MFKNINKQLDKKNNIHFAEWNDFMQDLYENDNGVKGDLNFNRMFFIKISQNLGVLLQDKLQFKGEIREYLKLQFFNEEI